MKLKQLYSGITEGREWDPADPVSYLLSIPYEMLSWYEGTNFGKGDESYRFIEDAESMLQQFGIPLPDHSKVSFSSIDDLCGWGNYFDGSFLSIVLHPGQQSGPETDNDPKDNK